MNQQQRKYATERVGAIKTIRTRQLTEAFAKLARPATTTGLLQALQVFGADIVKDDRKLDYHTSVGSIFDLGLFSGPTDEEREAHQQALADLDAEAGRVKDQIMLGDAEEALRILAAFAEGKS